MSRRLFIASLFDGRLVDKHYRNVVANGINAFAFDAFQRVPIGLELNFRLASRTREYFQEFLTNCHWLDLSKAPLRECGELTTKPGAEAGRLLGAYWFSLKRRRRWLIAAQGWSDATTLGHRSEFRSNPERVPRLANPFRVSPLFHAVSQGSRKLEPWAAISQRLRRIRRARTE